MKLQQVPVGQMTETQAVSSFAIFSAPAGTSVPPHNAPQPYICIVLAGEGEVATSDGKTLRLRTGELIYCDDVSGQSARPGRSPTFAWPS